MSRWTQSELGEAMDRRPRPGLSQASRSSQSSSEAEPGQRTSSPECQLQVYINVEF